VTRDGLASVAYDLKSPPLRMEIDLLLARARVEPGYRLILSITLMLPPVVKVVPFTRNSPSVTRISPAPVIVQGVAMVTILAACTSMPPWMEAQ